MLSKKNTSHHQVKAFFWKKGRLNVLEQKDLPHKIRYILCSNHQQAAKSIRDMSVRGAPAIGCVAAYGLALAAHEKSFTSLPQLISHLEKAKKTLAKTRPTAVNLYWALHKMSRCWQETSSVKTLQRDLIRTAIFIDQDDHKNCQKMGAFGAKLLKTKSTILTHCNAGALATAGHGTALGVVRSAHQAGKIKKVFVDETRPYWQGARLTAWECAQEKIPHELLTDNMAGHIMKTEKVSAVIVGADRIAANGDTANKIGTYSLAILAKHHNIPFYVAAPLSTIDQKTQHGNKIPIEERSTQEVTHIGKTPIAPKKTKARHPAFDVTPHHLISAIITEKGIIAAPNKTKIRSLFKKHPSV